MLRRYRGAYGLLKLHTVHRPDDDDYTMIEMDERNGRMAGRQPTKAKAFHSYEVSTRRGGSLLSTS